MKIKIIRTLSLTIAMYAFFTSSALFAQTTTIQQDEEALHLASWVELATFLQSLYEPPEQQESDEKPDVTPEMQLPDELSKVIELLNKGEDKEAEKTFEAWIKEDKYKIISQHGLAGIFFNRGNWQKAQKQYLAIIAVQAADARANLKLGTISILFNEFEEAETYLAKSLEKESGNREALLQLGKLYAIKGDSAARAITSLRRAYPGYDEDAELNFELANLYYSRKAYKESSFFFDRAIELGFKSPAHRLAYGKSLYYEGKFEEALVILRKVAREDAKNPEAHYFLGATLWSQKKSYRAVSSFEKADRLGDGYADAKYYIAKAQFEQGLYRAAMEKVLRYRINKLRMGQLNLNPQEKSLQLIVEIEKMLGIERRPNQVPGSDVGIVKITAGSMHYGFNGERLSEPVVLTTRAFEIDTREVSNADYKVFVEATNWPVPQPRKQDAKLKASAWNTETKTYPEGSAELPVRFVNWNDAIAYAAWIGKRLPTEKEWERAARGNLQENIYPWGNGSPGKNKALYGDADSPRSVEEGEPNGFGLLNIVGNVAEWCFDLYVDDLNQSLTIKSNIDAEKGALRSYRGGHYRSGPEDIRIFVRRGMAGGVRSQFIGFRCARDLPPQEQ